MAHCKNSQVCVLVKKSSGPSQAHLYINHEKQAFNFFFLYFSSRHQINISPTLLIFLFLSFTPFWTCLACFYSFLLSLLASLHAWARSLKLAWLNWPLFYLKSSLLACKSFITSKTKIIENQSQNNMKVMLNMQIGEYLIIYISCTSLFITKQDWHNS